MNKQKVYFPNLNGLRFIAAALVIIHHIEQIKSLFLLENFWGPVPFILVIGELGVILFFVLSGFLITYLLLLEDSIFSTISIKKFYIRRILRIWPLYFFIIILSLFILPELDIFSTPGYPKDIIYSNFIAKLLLFGLFFPNIVLSVYGIVPYASHTWSIGTEEQYYLIWPVLLKYFKRNRLLLMISIIFIYLLLLTSLKTKYTDFIPFKNYIIAFLSRFNIDCMAIGGIYAILSFEKNRILKYIKNEILFYAIIIVTLSLIINGIIFPYIHFEFFAILFGIIILNLATNDKIKVSLENGIFNYLGNISYGLYMYHPIGIVLAIQLVATIGIFTNWILYPISFLFTIIIAGVSYKYFESYFLKFKHKFSKIDSGNFSKE